MSLMRQIAWLVLGVVLAALVGAVGLSTLSLRQLMQTQLTLKNADNAQSLALALSQQQGDVELIKLLVSAQFDTGAYEFVRWRGAKGETLFERSGAPKPGQSPAWFRNLVAIEADPGVAQLSNGWNAIGAVELRSHAGYAHDALWLASRRLLAWLLMVGIVAAVLAWAGLRRIRRPLGQHGHKGQNHGRQQRDLLHTLSVNSVVPDRSRSFPPSLFELRRDKPVVPDRFVIRRS